MAIPKKIHYCWFGPKEIPEFEKQCILSWKEKLPDYEIVLWNEENFDINKIEYVKQAYEQKKYAFVSDCVRIYALYTYGGIYMDTDVEVLKNFDPYLENKIFMGFENRTMVGTGVIGAEKNSIIMKQMLDYYYNNSFIDKNGHLDITTNVKILADILEPLGFERENKEQIFENIHLYERDFFCPKKYEDNTFDKTDRTVTLHYFSGSWLSEKEKKRGTNKIWRNIFRPILKKIRILLIKMFGNERIKIFENKLRDKMR